MNQMDLERLAGFSDQVRDSTLKRLKSVPKGQENFRYQEGVMSFSDIADHLINSDRVHMNLLETRFLGKGIGRSGGKVVRSREEYIGLVYELEKLKLARHKFILELDEEKLSLVIPYEHLSGPGEAAFGSLLYQWLDHEIHHRGQISVYLKLLGV